MNYFFKNLVVALFFGVFMNGAWCDDFSVVEINHYSIHVPSGYVLRDITPQMADFELFEIVNKDDRSDKLSLYFGNFPQFPSYDWKESPTESAGAGVKKTFYNYRKSDGSLEGVLVFSGLSYRHSAYSPYSRIHYFATAVSSEASDRFLKIIASIEVVKPNL
jgi:hypothetical protein